MTEQKKTRKVRKKQENHGMTETLIYRVWSSMIARCRYEPGYIAKGIKVCEEWEQSFLAFYRDMGDRPTEKHQLDRRDPWGDYCKENCRWLLPKENSRNKTNQSMLTFDGKTLCLAEWADVTGINSGTILSRLDKGWSVERALTEKTTRGKLSEDEAIAILNKLGDKSLIGKVFGKLTVLDLHSRYKSCENTWLCLCECGKEKVVRTGKLNSGWVTSCGCDIFYDENGIRKTNPPPHLPTDTPEYQLWSGIKMRCKKLKRYTDRRITMLEEWENSYDSFLNYLITTIGLKPAKEYALDRIDNNQGYIRGNLRWTTVKENNRNKRNTRYISYNGKTQSVGAWAEEIGVDPDTLYFRLNKGWSIEKTLTTPVRQRKAK